MGKKGPKQYNTLLDTLQCKKIYKKSFINYKKTLRHCGSCVCFVCVCLPGPACMYACPSPKLRSQMACGMKSVCVGPNALACV